MNLKKINIHYLLLRIFRTLLKHFFCENLTKVTSIKETDNYPTKLNNRGSNNTIFFIKSSLKVIKSLVQRLHLKYKKVKLHNTFQSVWKEKNKVTLELKF